MSLSWRDKSLIREKVASKLVDQICQGLIDGRQLIPGLRETLGNSIQMVMNEPDNKDKISTSIVESVKSSIPSEGPLLLYGLLQNNNTYEFTKSTIGIIFTRVYQKNDTVRLFNNRLFDQLSDPPFNTWFGQQVGGKKTRKTRKSRRSKRKTATKKKKTRRKRKTTRRRKKQYGGMDGAEGAAGGVANAAGGVANAAGGVADAAGGVADAAGGVSENTEENKQVNDGAEANEGENVEANDGENAEEKEGENAEAKEGENAEDKEGEESSTQAASQSSASLSNGAGGPRYGVGSGPVPLSGGEIDQEANSLINKFDKELMNEVTKDLPSIKDQILTKLVNASYVHALKSGDTMFNSIIGSLNNSVQVNQNLINIFPIILVQAMVSSFKIIASTVSMTYNDEKKEASESGESKVEFNPIKDTFLMNFIVNLKKNLEEKINLD